MKEVVSEHEVATTGVEVAVAVVMAGGLAVLAVPGPEALRMIERVVEDAAGGEDNGVDEGEAGSALKAVAAVGLLGDAGPVVAAAAGGRPTGTLDWAPLIDE